MRGTSDSTVPALFLYLLMSVRGLPLYKLFVYEKD